MDCPGVGSYTDQFPMRGIRGATQIDATLVDATLGAALKYQEDLERVREKVPALVEQARRA